MKVGIIGSGGREHSICQSIKNSSKISEIFCFPGNAGTEKIANNVKLDLDNFEEIKDYILKRKIDLIIIGPEKPLVNGLVDFLEKIKSKYLDQTNLPHSLKALKFLQKNFVKNIIFQLLTLVFLNQKLTQKVF